MIITTNTVALSIILSKVKQAIYAKNAMPILQNVLFHEKDGEYYLIASSTELWISHKIQFSVDGNWFDFCLPVDRVISALSLLPDQPLFLNVADEKPHPIEFKTVDSTNKETKFTVSSVEAEAYPMWGNHRFEPLATELSIKSFLPSVKEAAKYSAKDLLRPVMNGVYLDFCSDKLVVVASDGHRLYKNVVKLENHLVKEGEHIGTNLTKELVALLLGSIMKDERVDISVDTTSTIRFATSDITVMGTMIEGTYPHYNRVIPSNNNKEVLVSKADLLRSVKLVSKFASAASELIVLDFGLLMDISARDLDFGESAKDSVVMIDSKMISSGFQVGLKSSTLLTCLSDIQTKNVRLLMNSASCPVLIKEDDENSDLTLLLMPMIVEY